MFLLPLIFFCFHKARWFRDANFRSFATFTLTSHFPPVRRKHCPFLLGAESIMLRHESPSAYLANHANGNTDLTNFERLLKQKWRVAITYKAKNHTSTVSTLRDTPPSEIGVKWSQSCPRNVRYYLSTLTEERWRASVSLDSPWSFELPVGWGNKFL